MTFRIRRSPTTSRPGSAAPSAAPSPHTPHIDNKFFTLRGGDTRPPSPDSAPKKVSSGNPFFDSINDISNTKWRKMGVYKKRKEFVDSLQQKRKKQATQSANERLSCLFDAMAKEHPLSVHCRELQAASNLLPEDTSGNVKRLEALLKIFYDNVPNCSCRAGEPSKCIAFVFGAFFAERGPDFLMYSLLPQYSARKQDPAEQVQAMRFQEYVLKVAWQAQYYLENLAKKVKHKMTKKVKKGWWSKNLFYQTVRFLFNTGASKITLIVLFEVLVGAITLPFKTGTARYVTEEDNNVYVARKEFVNASVLPLVMPALSRANIQNVVEALEYLNMLVIGFPKNSILLLRTGSTAIEGQGGPHGWLTWMTPLLTAGTVYLEDDDFYLPYVLLKKAEPASSNTHNLEEMEAPERKLLDPTNASVTIVKLLVNIIGTVLAQFFLLRDDPTKEKNDEEESNTPTQAHRRFASQTGVENKDQEGEDGGSANGKNMFKFMIEWMAILEDFAGWNSNTITLVRIILTSLFSRLISMKKSSGGDFSNDLQHPAWTSLFELLSVVENFVLYGGECLSGNIRPQNDRIFQVVGVHVDAAGNCGDLDLVERVLEFIKALGIISMSKDMLPSQSDKARLAKLQRKSKREIDFWTITKEYLLSFKSPDKALKKELAKKVSTLLESRRDKSTFGRSKNIFSKKKFQGSLDQAQAVAQRINEAPPVLNPAVAKFDLNAQLTGARRRGIVAPTKTSDSKLRVRPSMTTPPRATIAKRNPKTPKTPAQNPLSPRGKGKKRKSKRQSSGPRQSSDQTSGVSAAVYTTIKGRPQGPRTGVVRARARTTGDAPLSNTALSIPDPLSNSISQSTFDPLTNSVSASTFDPLANSISQSTLDPNLNSDTQQSQLGNTNPIPSFEPPHPPTSDPPPTPHPPITPHPPTEPPPPSPHPPPLSPIPGPPPTPTIPGPPPSPIPGPPLTPGRLTIPVSGEYSGPQVPRTPGGTLAPPPPDDDDEGGTGFPSTNLGDGVQPPPPPETSSDTGSEPGSLPTSPLPEIPSDSRPTSPFTKNLSPPSTPLKTTPTTTPGSSKTSTPSRNSPVPPTTISIPLKIPDQRVGRSQSESAASTVVPRDSTIRVTTTIPNLFPVNEQKTSEDDDDNDNGDLPLPPDDEDEEDNKDKPSLQLIERSEPLDSVGEEGEDEEGFEEDDEEDDEEMPEDPIEEGQEEEEGDNFDFDNDDNEPSILLHTCKHCECLLNEEEYERNGEFYCKKDFVALFCSCRTCDKPIKTSEACIRLPVPLETLGTDKNSNAEEILTYHLTCFNCYDCKKSLADALAPTPRSVSIQAVDGQNIFPHQRRIYCIADYYRKFGTTCEACGELIRGERLSALGSSFHPQHFCCAGPCGRTIEKLGMAYIPVEIDHPIYQEFKKTDPPRKEHRSTPSAILRKLGSFNEKEEELDEVAQVPFCSECFDLIFAHTCFACTKKITDDDGVSVGGDLEVEQRYYHKKCYTCSIPHCDEDTKTGMYLHSGILLCHLHYQEINIPKCIACNLRADDVPAVKIKGSIYHLSCLKCTDCSTLLDTKKLFTRPHKEDTTKEEFLCQSCASIWQKTNTPLASPRAPPRSAPRPPPISTPPASPPTTLTSLGSPTSAKSPLSPSGRPPPPPVSPSPGSSKATSPLHSPRGLPPPRPLSPTASPRGPPPPRPLSPSPGGSSSLSTQQPLSPLQSPRGPPPSRPPPTPGSSSASPLTATRSTDTSASTSTGTSTLTLDTIVPIVNDSSLCAACHGTILDGAEGENKSLLVKGSLFHMRCVKCRICSCALSLGPASSTESASQIYHSPPDCDPSKLGLYCKEDYVKTFLADSKDQCPMCQTPVVEGHVLQIGQDKYHGTCFHCFTCQKPFPDKKFVRDKSTKKFYCREHLPPPSK